MIPLYSRRMRGKGPHPVWGVLIGIVLIGTFYLCQWLGF